MEKKPGFPPPDSLRRQGPPSLARGRTLEGTPPVPTTSEARAGEGKGSSPGLLRGLAMAFVGAGLVAAPQANVAIVHAVDVHTDSSAGAAVGPVYLQVRGVLALSASTAGLAVDINPAAVAALVLARTAPELLKALRKGRSLGEWLRGPRLRPEDLDGLGGESLGLVDHIEMAPGRVRDEVMAYLAAQGVADAGELVAQIEAIASRPQAEHDVFISYSHADEPALPRLLHQRLAGQGLRAFFDNQSVHPGDDWYAQLQAQVSRSRVMAALITQNFRDSWWQKEEVLHKINLQREDPRHHRIVPVLIDDPGAAFGVLQLDALRYRRGEPAEPIVAAIVEAARDTL